MPLREPASARTFNDQDAQFDREQDAIALRPGGAEQELHIDLGQDGASRARCSPTAHRLGYTRFNAGVVLKVKSSGPRGAQLAKRRARPAFRAPARRGGVQGFDGSRHADRAR